MSKGVESLAKTDLSFAGAGDASSWVAVDYATRTLPCLGYRSSRSKDCPDEEAFSRSDLFSKVRLL